MNYLRQARVFASQLPDHCECECPNCNILFDVPDSKRGDQIQCPNRPQCKCLMGIPHGFYESCSEIPEQKPLFALCPNEAVFEGYDSPTRCGARYLINDEQAHKPFSCERCRQNFTAIPLTMEMAFPRPKSKPNQYTIMTTQSETPKKHFLKPWTWFRKKKPTVGEGDWEVEVPQFRMNRTFAFMLILHVVAVGGLFAYRTGFHEPYNQGWSAGHHEGLKAAAEKWRVYTEEAVAEVTAEKQALETRLAEVAPGADSKAQEEKIETLSAELTAAKSELERALKAGASIEKAANEARGKLAEALKAKMAAEAQTKAMEKYGDDSISWLKQTVKEKLKYEFIQDKDGAWGLVPTQ